MEQARRLMRLFRALLLSLLLIGLCPVAQADEMPWQHAITLFGKPKYAPGFSHFDYVNPNAPKGGRLKLADTIAFNSLNPFILKGIAPTDQLALCFDTLMRASIDEPQTYYGLIAEGVYLSPRHDYMDFRLRETARWHDDAPITADDVVFSFNILKKEGHPTYRVLYAPIERAEKIGPYWIRFRFSDRQNRQLPLLAASMPVLPKHYYQDVTFDKTTLTPPLSSGPYRITRVDQGRRLRYERVKDYWAKDLPVNRGTYNFDVIRVEVFRDETVALEAFKSGHYDLRQEYIARNWATAYTMPAIEDGRVKKQLIRNSIPSGMQAFIFNTRQPKFSDARVREAIALSLDYEWMNKSLFYGAYERSTSFFEATPFMATGIPSGDELALLEPFRDTLPARLFKEPFRLPKTDGSGFAREQLLKAQQLLNDAGWVLKDGQRRHHQTGEALSIEFMMRQRTFERVVGSMIRNLDKLGIDATFRYVDDSQYQKRIESRDFDSVSVWWNYGNHFPGSEQMSFWHSSQADQSGSQNLAGLKDPAVDTLLQTLSGAADLDSLSAAAKALDRVLLWGHYVIPHWHLGYWRLAYWNKFGQPDIAPTYNLPIFTWWLDKKKQAALEQQSEEPAP